MVNELRKNGLKKTNLEINIQFINSLRSEWRRFASNIQQNHDLDEIDIHELYEMLNHNQDEILESEKKISRPVSDRLALVAERRHGQHSRSARVEIDSDIPSDEGEDGSGSESDLHEMKKPIALLSRFLNKKYSRRPTSNNHRYSSSSGMNLEKDSIHMINTNHVTNTNHMTDTNHVTSMNHVTSIRHEIDMTSRKVRCT